MEQKTLVIITTYNRNYELLNLTEQLLNETNADIVIFDDKSDNEMKIGSTRVTQITNPEHRGKAGFWHTWQDIFNYCKEHEYDYYIFLQDDVTPCPDFVAKAISIYNEAECICVSPIRTNYSMYRNQSRWGAKPVERHANHTVSHYFDCFGIVRRDFFEALDWMIVPIAPSSDPFKSSGVGRQITRRLQEAGKKMAHVNRTLLSTAIDPTASSMNEQERQRHPMVADFADNENCVDIHMASLWRGGHVVKTIESLLQQPETATVFVTLNSYTNEQYKAVKYDLKVLAEQYGKKVVTRRANNEKGSNEKLSQLSKSKARYIAFADDDFIYPQDYLLHLIHGLRIHEGVVSLHGSQLTAFPIRKYYGGDRRMFSWNVMVPEDTQVDIIGTGVCLLKREWFTDEELKALYVNAPATSMDDIIVSCLLSQKGIARYVIEHLGSSVTLKEHTASDNYVYDTYKDNDSEQVAYINANYRKYAK